jgi:hypothetical protein
MLSDETALRNAFNKAQRLHMEEVRSHNQTERLIAQITNTKPTYIKEGQPPLFDPRDYPNGQ